MQIAIDNISKICYNSNINKIKKEKQMQVKSVQQLGTSLFFGRKRIAKGTSVAYKNGYFHVARRGSYVIYDRYTGKILIENVKNIRVLSENTFFAVIEDGTAQIIKSYIDPEGFQIEILHSTNEYHKIGSNYIFEDESTDDSLYNNYKLIDKNGKVLRYFTGEILACYDQDDFAILKESNGAIYVYHASGKYQRLNLSDTKKAITYRGFKNVFLLDNILLKLEIDKSKKYINVITHVLRYTPKLIGKNLLECRLLHSRYDDKTLIIDRNFDTAFRCYSVTTPTYYEPYRYIIAHDDNKDTVSYTLDYKKQTITISSDYLFTATGALVKRVTKTQELVSPIPHWHFVDCLGKRRKR